MFWVRKSNRATGDDRPLFHFPVTALCATTIASCCFSSPALCEEPMFPFNGGRSSIPPVHLGQCTWPSSLCPFGCPPWWDGRPVQQCESATCAVGRDVLLLLGRRECGTPASLRAQVSRGVIHTPRNIAFVDEVNLHFPCATCRSAPRTRTAAMRDAQSATRRWASARP